MANERNVEALALALFQEQAQKPNGQVSADLLRGTGFWTLAERLASRGVLVPSAIDDKEAEKAWEAAAASEEETPDYGYWWSRWRGAKSFREALELIAKGE